MPKHRIVPAAILAVVLALAAGGDVLAGRADYPEQVKEIIAVNFAREIMEGGYKAVTADQLKKWTDEKKEVLIVDTMPLEESYKKEHVPGAVQIEFPIPEMKEIDDKKKAEFLKLLGPDKDRLMVFYCGFVECTRSHNAAMWAVNLGYKNVYRFPGGIMGWAQAGYPTAKGDK
jgi:rhodanese-related sulfurtransferase